jgi:hypothetical protein
MIFSQKTRKVEGRVAREREREQRAKEWRPESTREANPDTTSEGRVFGVCLLTTSCSQFWYPN